MTLADLVRRLEPIALDALATPENEDVSRVAVVLAALMGSLTDEIDREALQALAVTAHYICEHRLGRHQH